MKLKRKQGLFVFWLFILLLAPSCKEKCKVLKTKDEIFKSYSQKGVLKREDIYTKSKQILFRQYFSDSIQNDSIYEYDSKGNVIFKRVKQKHFLDSIFIYDTLGQLSYSCHYKNTIMVKRVSYWDNGEKRDIMDIQRSDTIPIVTDTTIQLTEFHVLYSGYMHSYSEGGKLESQGPITKNKHSGIWLYYDSDEKIIRQDTLQ